MRAFSQKPEPTHQTESAQSVMPTRVHSFDSGVVSSTLPLQHSIGNRDVQRLSAAHMVSVEGDSTTTDIARVGHDFSRIPIGAKEPAKIQSKLMVNTPGDVYEQEADRVADQMMLMPEPSLQRACPGSAGHADCQTEQPRQEHEPLQTKRVGSSDVGQPTAPSVVHEVLRSSGQPIDPAARSFMESRFGHDFSRVRVHTDAKASKSADAIGASAYTIGHHIVFGEQRYAPQEIEGSTRLAHELAHVVQQDFRIAPNLRIGTPGDSAEAEAADAAKIAVHGGLMRPLHGGWSGVIQRDDGRQSRPVPSTSGLVEPAKVTTRQATTDIITSLSGSITDQEWESKRNAASKVRPSVEADKLYIELYTEVAKLAQVDKFADVLGTKAQSLDIHIEKAQGDPKPGLNFMYALSPNGQTGYIDTKGNVQARIPITTSGLPTIAIQLGPKAFSLNKAYALAILRHEMMHAEHNRSSIELLKEWQKQTGGKVKQADAEHEFRKWLDKQKGKISLLQFDLAQSDVEGGTLSSELLSYTEGFMTIYHLEPVLNDTEISKAASRSYAIMDILTAGEKWGSARESVQKETLGRLQQYYCDVLDKPRRTIFDKWVTLKLMQANSTEKMSLSEKATQNQLIPIIPFLNNLAAISKIACGKTTTK